MASFPYICLGCGKTFTKRQSLSAHLSHCFWWHRFRDEPEASPFYHKMLRRNRLRAKAREKRYHGGQRIRYGSSNWYKNSY